MDVSDAFNKLKEQILICLDTNNPAGSSDSHMSKYDSKFLNDYARFDHTIIKNDTFLHQQHTSGLYIINNTNLEYFNNEQKSEIFLLKSQFLYRLNYITESKASILQSIQTWLHNHEAWLTWGQFSAALFKKSIKESMFANSRISAIVSVESAIKNVECSILLTDQHIEDLSCYIVCVLKSIQYMTNFDILLGNMTLSGIFTAPQNGANVGTDAMSNEIGESTTTNYHLHLSQVLYYCLYFNDENNKLIQVLLSHYKNIPVNHFIPYVPYLLQYMKSRACYTLSCSQENEQTKVHCKLFYINQIIIEVSKFYPESVLHYIRNEMESFSVMPNKIDRVKDGNKISCFKHHVEKIYQSIQRQYPMLTYSMNTFATQFTRLLMDKFGTITYIYQWLHIVIKHYVDQTEMYLTLPPKSQNASKQKLQFEAHDSVRAHIQNVLQKIALRNENVKGKLNLKSLPKNYMQLLDLSLLEVNSLFYEELNTFQLEHVDKEEFSLEKVSY